MNTLKNPPLIERTGKLSTFIHMRDVLLTLLMWVLYVVYMKDFFLFLGDVGKWSLTGFVDTASYASFFVLKTIAEYAGVVVIIGVLFVLWSLYNQVRFRYNNRRRFVQTTTDKQIGDAFIVKPSDLKRLRRARSITLSHDAEGRLTEIRD